MLYHFELQMAGVILLTCMLVCGISLWLKRRRDRIRQEAEEEDRRRQMLDGAPSAEERRDIGEEGGDSRAHMRDG